MRYVLYGDMFDNIKGNQASYPINQCDITDILYNGMVNYNVKVATTLKFEIILHYI